MGDKVTLTITWTTAGHAKQDKALADEIADHAKRVLDGYDSHAKLAPSRDDFVEGAAFAGSPIGARPMVDRFGCREPIAIHLIGGGMFLGTIKKVDGYRGIPTVVCLHDGRDIPWTAIAYYEEPKGPYTP